MLVKDRIKEMEAVRIPQVRECACKICGQIRIEELPGPEYLSDEDADEYATEECTCTAGEAYRWRKMRKTAIESAIEEINSKAEFEMNESTRELAKQAVQFIFTDLVNVTLEDSTGTKINIKHCGDKIKITANKKYTIKSEA